MAENGQKPAKLRLAGYAALIELYDLDVIPNWHRSLVATSGIHRTDSTGEVIEEVYPERIEERPQRSTSVPAAAASEHPHAAHLGLQQVLVEQPGLALPRLPGDDHDVLGPVDDARSDVAKPLHLLLPAHQRR